MLPLKFMGIISTKHTQNIHLLESQYMMLMDIYIISVYNVGDQDNIKPTIEY